MERTARVGRAWEGPESFHGRRPGARAPGLPSSSTPPLSGAVSRPTAMSASARARTTGAGRSVSLWASIARANRRQTEGRSGVKRGRLGTARGALPPAVDPRSGGLKRVGARTGRSPPRREAGRSPKRTHPHMCGKGRRALSHRPASWERRGRRVLTREPGSTPAERQQPTAEPGASPLWPSLQPLVGRSTEADGPGALGGGRPSVPCCWGTGLDDEHRLPRAVRQRRLGVAELDPAGPLAGVGESESRLASICRTGHHGANAQSDRWPRRLGRTVPFSDGSTHRDPDGGRPAARSQHPPAVRGLIGPRTCP